MNAETALMSEHSASMDMNRKPRVMVVNDTQEILQLFQDILEDEGFEVSLYSFAVRDLDDIIRVNPDLVILDFMMGGEAQGWQLLQKMKMSRVTENIPVIVCTAAVQMARELEGHLTTKNVGLVLKPFDIDDLLSAVHAVIAETPKRFDTATS
jgi:DNA-binding response OmpR family regulator